MKQHNYTEEEKDFLRDNIKGRSYEELRLLFHERFGIELTKGQIKGFIARYGLTNGRDCKFQKGQVSHNKGKKGISYAGMEATQFKKGNTPHNHRPVGSERINVDGYIEVKVAEPKKWKQKHVLVWEDANGSVPKGYAVIFLDGDRQNVAIDNLRLVSRGELAIVNKRGLLKKDAGLSETGILIAKVYLKCGKRKKDRA